MPLSATFTWTEDLDTVTFVVRVPAVKANRVTIVLSPVYVKVNQSPHFFEQDLVEDIDLDHSQARVGVDRVTLVLKKKQPGKWGDFRYANSAGAVALAGGAAARESLMARRKASLATWEERERKLTEQRKDQRWKLNKKAEEEQWRIDREGREKIEQWKEEEKQLAEDDVFEVLDKLGDQPQATSFEQRKGSAEETYNSTAGGPSESTSSIFRDPAPKGKIVDLDGLGGDDEDGASSGDEVAGEEEKGEKSPKKTKEEEGEVDEREQVDSEDEYQMEVLPPVRKLPEVRRGEKMILPMTRHAKPGVPARDRPGRAPPHPRDLSGIAAPKQHRLEGEADHDESDPVWLKDKADRCMAAGDYPSALQAYTSALTEYSNARAFANRAVCNLYLGKLAQAVEDCGHAIKILNMKLKVPDGHCAPPKDPEDEKVRARCLVRRGVCFLWLGDYRKCEEAFAQALSECEPSALNADERAVLMADLDRVRKAAKAYSEKKEVDRVLRGCTLQSAADIAEKRVVEKYDAAFSVEGEENAVLSANRCFTKLQAGDLPGCLGDAELTIKLLARWPVARGAPKPPEKPQRLDPPTLEDHTFRNPNTGGQAGGKDDRDWLMKHHGDPTGTQGGKLPDIPDDFEWVKDASEKKDDCWIAVRKKLTREQVQSIRGKITKFQEALYTRNLEVIDAAIEVAKEQNLAKEGPCNEAIHQAYEYREKLNTFLEEEKVKRELEKGKTKEEERTSEAFFERSLCTAQPGCFRRDHPVEKTRRRLFVKTKLREARAYELQKRFKEVAACLDLILLAEPKNPDAKQLQLKIKAELAVAADGEVESVNGSDKTAAAAGASSSDAKAQEVVARILKNGGGAGASGGTSASAAATGAHQFAPASRTETGPTRSADNENGADDDDDDEDDADPEDSSLSPEESQKLVGTATKYLENGDFESALQIFSYARRKGTFGEDRFEDELRVRLNCCLCLQKLKRVKDLLSSCDDTLEFIKKSATTGTGGNNARLEAACRTRRAWALNQLNRSTEGAQESKKARELLAA